MPQNEFPDRFSIAGAAGALWGIIGVLLLIGGAVYRLTPLALAAFSSPFYWYHWLAWIASVLIMAHTEGYRGFQLHFSPRVAARAFYLHKHPNILYVIFAPLFCMGYFHATRRRKAVSLTLTIGIMALVLAVRLLAQPWRGIVNAGVVIGLAWGLVSILWFAARVFTGRACNYSPEVPESSASNSR